LLLDYSLKIHADKPAPSQIAIKLGAAAKALGSFWQNKALENEGEKILNLLNEQSAQWGCPVYLGEILTALQMVYPKLSASPWKSLWKYLGEVWYHPSCSYIGPGMKEFQDGFEPQPTLLDLYMGYFSKVFSNRAIANHQPFLLQGALIQSADDV